MPRSGRVRARPNIGLEATWAIPRQMPRWPTKSDTQGMDGPSGKAAQAPQPRR